VTDYLLHPDLSCPYNIRKGVTNEPISNYAGTIKGRTAIRVLNKFRHLKQKPYWGNHFWSRGYCVDTVDLDSEMIRKYVKYQEVKERREKEKQRKLF
jgi:putative transposase